MPALQRKKIENIFFDIMIRDLQKLIWSFLPFEARMQYELQLDLQNRVWSFLGFEDQAICDLQTGCPPVNYEYLSLHFAIHDDAKSMAILNRYHPAPIGSVHMAIWKDAKKCIRDMQNTYPKATIINLACSCQNHELLLQYSLDEIMMSNPHDAIAWDYLSAYHPDWNLSYYNRLVAGSSGIEMYVARP